MANYFFNPGRFAEIGIVNAAVNNDFLFNQGPTRGLGKIQFHDYKIAYNSLGLPNIKVFKTQIALLVELLMSAPPDKEQIKQMGICIQHSMLGVRCWTFIAF